jgi:chromosome segregation ATPase
MNREPDECSNRTLRAAYSLIDGLEKQLAREVEYNSDLRMLKESVYTTIKPLCEKHNLLPDASVNSIQNAVFYVCQALTQNRDDLRDARNTAIRLKTEMESRERAQAEQINNYKDALGRSTESFERLQAKTEAYKREAADCKQELDHVNALYIQMREKYEEEGRISERLRGKYMDAYADLEHAKRTVATLNRERPMSDGQKALMIAERDLLREQLRALQDECAALAGERAIFTRTINGCPCTVRDQRNGPTERRGDNERRAMHSPEPWQFQRHSDGEYLGNIIAYYPANESGIKGVRTITCQLKYGTPEENEANAKRIVDCVNACEGVNPEALPDLLLALEDAFRLVKVVGRENYVFDRTRAALAAVRRTGR